MWRDRPDPGGQPRLIRPSRHRLPRPPRAARIPRILRTRRNPGLRPRRPDPRDTPRPRGNPEPLVPPRPEGSRYRAVAHPCLHGGAVGTPRTLLVSRRSYSATPRMFFDLLARLLLTGQDHELQVPLHHLYRAPRPRPVRARQST